MKIIKKIICALFFGSAFIQPVEMKADVIRILPYVTFEGSFKAGKWGSNKLKNTVPSLSLAKRDLLGFVATPGFSVGIYPIERFCQILLFGPEASRKKLKNSVSKKKPADFKKQQKIGGHLGKNGQYF